MAMHDKRGMPYVVVLLVSILLLLGGIGFWAINKVADLTQELYDHPYTVSTAVLRIKANIMGMHLVMDNLLLATTAAEVKTYEAILNHREEEVLKDFAVVKERFLGDPKMVDDALQSFMHWKEIRAEVITNTLNGKKIEMSPMNQDSCALQAEEVENKIDALLAFASNKAKEFKGDAQITRSSTSRILLASFLVAMLLAMVLFRRAIGLEEQLQKSNEQLEEKVVERTGDLMAVNEEMTALNEEITAMNDELVSMNEKLESRVEERTSELFASYQEVKATEEELRAQFENLQEIQEALQEEKMLTDALFDSIPGMLYLYDHDGKLIRWNKRHEEMTGYSAGELLGMDLLAWYKGDDATIGRIQRAVEKALRDGFAEAEADLLRKDGTKIVAYLTAVPLDINGKIHFAGIGLDIAERKKAKEELVIALEKAEKANLAKGQFLANMSHEIRTPMNGIIGMTDLTLLTNLGEEQREYLTIVKSSTISLLRVLNDILDYSKVEAGKIEIEDGPFDLRKIMNEVVDLFGIAARQKGIKLGLKVDRAVPNHIIGDAVRLRQVLSNLVGNGIKFTDQGEVSIHVGVGEQLDKKVKLKFSVTDTGIGIAKNKFHKLFKRFSQVDDSTTRQFGGTGLGLAISKKLIEIMDGEISVESEENVGSKFYFTAVFGMLADKAKVLEKEIANQKILPANNESLKKILLAEDDGVSRNMVTIMLKQKGFVVVAVENGMEALTAFEKDKFDLILMDVNMPYMDGYSATAKIREIEENRNYHTPIIAMTAYALKGDREKCLEMGMDDYISKPISLNQAMELIGKYILANPPEDTQMEDNKELAEVILSLVEASGLSREISEGIIADFSKQGVGLISDIKKGIDGKNFKDAGILLHKLKGSAGNIRAEKIAKHAKEAEEALKVLDLVRLNTLLSEIEVLLQELHIKKSSTLA